MAGTKIAVLGAGKIGSTLGRKWVGAGNSVTFGVSDPNGQHAQEIKADLGNQAAIGTIAEALADAEVVVFAIPGPTMAETIAANAPALTDKLVIDAANRMGEPTANSLEDFRRHAPSARYVRAFNTLGWENFAEPDHDGEAADLLYCGPEGDRDVVERLVVDVGLRPCWVGGAEQADLLDGATRLWFALVMGRGRSRRTAFRVLD